MSKNKVRAQDALEYHEFPRPGKIEVVPTKETETQRDLALAYSPGVAEPCLKIAANPDDVYRYTAKGNLVAVISDGTAVLGLGDIGPAASKPVMEGKGLLFKIFAGIDVFDLELDTKSIDEFVRTVKILEPTFGGVNLEDIKAPACFEIEERLKKELNIPVMHDDQHGTAIISSAGLLNAVQIVKKDIDKIRITISGAGASAISCAKLMVSLGVSRENVVMCDSSGVIRSDRGDLSKQKAEFATDRDLHTLDDAMADADVFLGLSKANVVTPEMLLKMAPRPIVFALANPDPEIEYKLAVSTRDDLIMATGRSDYPNQVNNVLGFPFIFRGALDVRATEINEAMKLAAVRAIAELAKKPVPEIVNMAYNEKNITFGSKYIIPKPMDPRLLETVAPAVAKAAIESGVARINITDWDEYKLALKKRMGNDDHVISMLNNKAKLDPQRIVFADGDHYNVLKAAQIIRDEGIGKPILLGSKDTIARLIKEHELELGDTLIIDPKSEDTAEIRKEYGEFFFEKVKRKGYNYYEALSRMRVRNFFGSAMVEKGDADAIISGMNRKYSDTIRPALDIIGTYKKGKKVSGMYILLSKQGPLFLADTTVITNPTSEELVEIALLTSRAARKFNIEPRIAFLSFSNFGSSSDPESRTVHKAVEILKEKYPDLVVDGEIQANFAFNTDALEEHYPFSPLVSGPPNILIFPNLAAGNISYKLLQCLGAGEAIGPILLGMKKSVHILQLGSSVREIVNMATIAAVDAQEKKNEILAKAAQN